ncbi:hypothetical protein VPH35_080157 [Triticum aestivum]|uniref:syntaxin-52 n=1 Tax=Triticum aestivum TaxID=4565 RepID=UPI00162D3A0A|nr:syntaxin-52-like [Triticum aestivum]
MSNINRSHPALPMATFQPKGFAPAPSPLEQWTKRFQEAERLVEEVMGNIAERGSVPASLSLELKRRTGEIRRKVAILETRLSLMREDLDRLPNRNVKEMRKLAEKFDALELKVREVAAPFTMKKHSSNRNELLGPNDDRCTVVDIKSTANMENQEIVQLQRNIMKEQDECLDRLEETIVSTKHIALAINEELDLHVRLIDDLDERVEDTSTQLQRAQKKLKSLNTRMRKSGSCTGILVSIIAGVIFVAVVWALIKF